MGYSRKNSNRGVWGYTFLKILLEFFIFFTLPQEIPDKTKLIHLHKIVLDPFWKFQGQKQTPLEIPSNFPWSSLEIPLCFY